MKWLLHWGGNIAQTYFPLQKIKKENKDGSLIVETTVCDYMEVLPVVKSWIPEIVVEKPNDLRREIKKVVDEYAKQS